MSSSHIFVLCIIFMVVVVPVLASFWSDSKKYGGKSQINMNKVDELNEMATRLSERVKNLESILDAETPEWRKKYDA